MSEIQVIARYTVKEGKVEELLALVAELAAASRTEPGNLSFTSYRSTDDPGSVVLLERYTSKEAFAAHRETPHFKRLVADRIIPLLESRAVEQFVPAG
jgi:quinol monooxygenase YgiN